MKHFGLVLLLNVLSYLSFSQIRETVVPITYDTPAEKQKGATSLSSAVSFRLFATQNMWTFIKLDTRNGRMWQVQFDVEGNNRHETFLSLEVLVQPGEETNDRFTLHSTQNIYNFILLDQHDGRTWQVQWSTKPENRGILPIN